MGSRIARSWQSFWFSSIPSEPLAVVRIAVGVAALIDLAGLVPISMFWTPDSLIPLPGGGVGVRGFIVDAGLGTLAGWGVFLALVTAYACMTVGLFTGTAVTVCFIGSVLHRHWNILPLNAAHGVLIAVLFCLVWADCGARLSVDAWRQRRRSLPPLPTHQPIWPLRLLRIQIAVVYASSGLFKLLTPEWRNGTALEYAISNNIYGRIFHAVPFPTELDWALTLLTYATVFWELTFPLLLLHPVTRAAALVMGIGFHLGIWATLEVGSFSLIMLATYPAFLNPQTVARFVNRRRPVAPAPSVMTAAPTRADSSPAA